MSIQPRPRELANVRVALRVTVVKRAWDGPDLENEVRDYCVERLREAPHIHSVRRDVDRKRS